MKTNAYEYLRGVIIRKHLGNISFNYLLKQLEHIKKQKIDVVNKNGHLVQVVDKRREYELRKINQFKGLK